MFFAEFDHCYLSDDCVDVKRFCIALVFIEGDEYLLIGELLVEGEDAADEVITGSSSVPSKPGSASHTRDNRLRIRSSRLEPRSRFELSNLKKSLNSTSTSSSQPCLKSSLS